MLYSSMTEALEGGKWPVARPGRTLPPGKTRYPFYRTLGGPQGRSGQAENLVRTGIFLIRLFYFVLHEFYASVNIVPYFSIDNAHPNAHDAN